MPTASWSNTGRRIAEAVGATLHSGSTKARVLLFGASSAIGQALLQRLAGAAVEVNAITRAETLPVASAGQRWHHGALPEFKAPSTGYTHIISLGPGDAFIDWLAHQPRSAELRQIIALGSTSAHTKFESASLQERDLATRLRGVESSLVSEAQRLDTHWTLLRPTLIYGGAQDSVARLGNFIRRRRVYPVLLGSASRALRQPVHAADLAQAVQACIDLVPAYDRSFDLPGGESLSLSHFVRRIARACDRVALPLPLPLGMALAVLERLRLIPAHAALAGAGSERIARDQVFDVDPARQTLGFAPRAFLPNPAEW